MCKLLQPNTWVATRRCFYLRWKSWYTSWYCPSDFTQAYTLNMWLAEASIALRWAVIIRPWNQPFWKKSAFLAFLHDFLLFCILRSFISVKLLCSVCSVLELRSCVFRHLSKRQRPVRCQSFIHPWTWRICCWWMKNAGLLVSLWTLCKLQYHDANSMVLQNHQSSRHTTTHDLVQWKGITAERHA